MQTPVRAARALPALGALAALSASPLAAQQEAGAVAVEWRPAADSARRPRAIEYSDWYGRRLTAHRYGSYAMLPLFAAEYALGDRLMNGTSTPPTAASPTPAPSAPR